MEMPSSRRQPARLDDVIGAHVRVVTRRGRVIEGTCLDGWVLRNGGLAIKIKPDDGSSPQEVTTLEPLVLISDQPGGGHASRRIRHST